MPIYDCFTEKLELYNYIEHTLPTHLALASFFSHHCALSLGTEYAKLKVLNIHGAVSVIIMVYSIVVGGESIYLGVVLSFLGGGIHF